MPLLKNVNIKFTSMTHIAINSKLLFMRWPIKLVDRRCLCYFYLISGPVTTSWLETVSLTFYVLRSEQCFLYIYII